MTQPPSEENILDKFFDPGDFVEELAKRAQKTLLELAVKTCQDLRTGAKGVAELIAKERERRDRKEELTLITANRADTEPERVLRLRRVVARLHNEGVIPHRVHDHKGVLTMWWGNAPSDRAMRAAVEAWNAENEHLIEHRLCTGHLLVSATQCTDLPWPAWE